MGTLGSWNPGTKQRRLEFQFEWTFQETKVNIYPSVLSQASYLHPVNMPTGAHTGVVMSNADLLDRSHVLELKNELVNCIALELLFAISFVLAKVHLSRMDISTVQDDVRISARISI